MDAKQRVSCAALCRITDAQGRYLLVLNYNRLQYGRRVYTALGGALTFNDPLLPVRFGATLEDPCVQEFRWYLPPDRVEEFRAWFKRRCDRETTPFREIEEELVQELNVLPRLHRSDIRSYYRYTLERERFTDRGGVEPQKTVYLHEIFDVRLVSPHVREALEFPAVDSGLRWVTRAEIEAGESADGDRIDAGILIQR